MTKSIRFRRFFLASAVSAALVAGAFPSFAEDKKEVAPAEAAQSDAPQKVISLRDAVAIGVATNPEYGVVAASRRATDEELNQGQALFLPSIDLSADAGYEYTDDVGTRAGTGDDTEELFRKQVGITLTQMLFDGFEARYEVKRQEARVASSANRVRETAELIGLSIVESYLEVMRQRQLLVIARRNVSDHVAILDQIQDGVNAGRSTQADLEQAKARLASARTVESSTRQALRNAESRYRQEVGDPPADLEFPQIPFDQLSPDVEEEVVQSIANSPTLSIFESDIEVAYAEAQGTKSTMYPQLDLQLNARTGEDLGGIEDEEDTSASALLVLNWNLYRGGADVARAREFVHRHQQSKEERADAARQVENDVRQTWAGMVSAGERATQFSAQAEANAEVVKAYKDQFNLDRRTLLDVLDAQNELFVSRSNAVNSEFLEMFAVYRLLALKGKLLPVLGVESPRESALASSDEWSYKEKMKAR